MVSDDTDNAERQAIARVRRLRRLIENGTGMSAIVVTQHPTGCAMSIQLVVEVDKGLSFSDMSESGREALGEALGKTALEWLSMTDDMLFDSDEQPVRLVQ